MAKPKINSIHIVVIAFAMLCGFSGIIAGIFELMQGDSPTDNYLISTIGPEFKMFQSYQIKDIFYPYCAFTILPNFLITGITAILSSSLVIFWSIKFIQLRYGAVVFFLLCIMQFLLGGRFVLDMALLTSLMAILINKRLTWWSKVIPAGLQRVLAYIWPWSLLLYIVNALALLIIPILGVNKPDLQNLLNLAATIMFVPIFLMIFGGIGYQIQLYRKHQIKDYL